MCGVALWINFLSLSTAFTHTNNISFININKCILIEFGIPVKLVWLIKMCLTEMYSSVRVAKNLSDMFPIRNGLKQGDALYLLLSNLP